MTERETDDGGSGAEVDPWEAMARWRDGRCSAEALGMVIAATIGDLDDDDDECQWDPELFESWWDELGRDLDEFGFGPVDFDVCSRLSCPSWILAT